VTSAEDSALAPFASSGGENPHAIPHELQEQMFALVGIIRTAKEMEQALKEVEKLKARAGNITVEGGRAYNPGWHTALDLKSMLLVSEAVGKAALTRTESRGGHTRDDYPKTDPELGKVNLIVTEKNGKVAITRKPLPKMPADLAKLFEEPAK
jgi:succinate dehydrogenase / fumarate reductase flavoprotein subunit